VFLQVLDVLGRHLGLVDAGVGEDFLGDPLDVLAGSTLTHRASSTAKHHLTGVGSFP